MQLRIFHHAPNHAHREQRYRPSDTQDDREKNTKINCKFMKDQLITCLMLYLGRIEVLDTSEEIHKPLCSVEFVAQDLDTS
jgi:hypothetical protein